MNIDVRHILQLTTIPGVGPGRIKNLVNYFKETELIFKVSISELVKVEGIDKGLAKRIIEMRNQNLKFADEQLLKAEKVKARILTLWDSEYPDLLRKIYDPPIVLFIRGNLVEQDRYSIAIVGTRTPTNYGKIMCEKFAMGLSKMNLTIVSGFARGIDTIAHVSALKSGGRTIAVLGSGVDYIYPPENRKIVDSVISNGAIVSEFPMGAKPDAMNFPKRNRIISGMSIGVLIVETSRTGGAMITAEFANDQNRDVFAIPGNVDNVKSQGTNFLIKHNRAKLVEDVNDIVEEIRSFIQPILKSEPSKPKVEVNVFEAKILEVLSTTEPMHVDKIAELSGLSITDALVHLLSLEFKDLVHQLPGKLFVKKF
ncbi:DNA-processing protein DprA [Candidatus Kryptobacter tengchongensis]|uniref:DNA processing protein n=1 Tax=Kryptobacter tengchongensis TaxID=1643429 RepID=A0A656DAR9_KRYT1|nr:DNA-processing protein DprA [Candidatus Kryptobacter tengchongensis]CUT03569.1 DNA processing protein [Candidatus Kryptobacter tengchongensis]